MLRFVVILSFMFLGHVVLYGQSIDTNEKGIKSFDYNKVYKQLIGVNNLNSLEVSLSDASPESFVAKTWAKIKEDVKKTTGRVEVGYSYGLNTVFTDTTRGISSIFVTSGAMQTGLLGLPVQVSYNYSTLKHPLGANNYFRISFDKERFLDSQKEKIEEQLSKVEGFESKLEKSKSNLSGVQGYSEVYLNMLKQRIGRETQRLVEVKKQQVRDSLMVLADTVGDKSLDYSKETRINPYSDSLQEEWSLRQKQLEHYKNEYDSIMGIYQKILSVQQTYDSLLTVYGAYKDKLESYSSNIKDTDLLTLGKESVGNMGFIKSIQKVDIGLTYPKTTALSTQTTPIKGVGTEFQYKQFYLSISSGLTLNNIMLSTNEITNQLDYNQNVFNQFDFQQVKDNGLLTTLKTGWGTSEETHAFIGFNYLTNTRFLGGDTSVYDPAASFELDLRYVPKFYKGGAIDIVYGKTSSNKQIDPSSELGVFESLFSTYQSSAFLAKYTQEISVLRSDFSLQFRSIDPFTNTTVYGFMQPGNRRYAFESRHRISSYLRIGTTYKIDESYGNSAYLYKLNTLGLNASGNYTEYFTYSVMLNHVRYSLRKPSSEVEKGNNYLAGINLQSNYSWKDLKWMTGVTYNDYLISDTIQATKYTQFGVMQTIGNREWTTFFKYDYFFKSAANLITGTHVLSMGGRYDMENIRLDAGISLASEKGEEHSLGGYLDVLYQVNKWIDISFRAERFVMGGFYRNYYRTLYERFPYLISINLGLKF